MSIPARSLDSKTLMGLAIERYAQENGFGGTGAVKQVGDSLMLRLNALLSAQEAFNQLCADEVRRCIELAPTFNRNDAFVIEYCLNEDGEGQ